MEESEIYRIVKALGIDKYEFDERAGILEFDAGYPRQLAEKIALDELYEYYRQPVLIKKEK